jgi:hypothetical protein
MNFVREAQHKSLEILFVVDRLHNITQTAATPSDLSTRLVLERADTETVAQEKLLVKGGYIQSVEEAYYL